MCDINVDTIILINLFKLICVSKIFFIKHENVDVSLSLIINPVYITFKQQKDITLWLLKKPFKYIFTYLYVEYVKQDTCIRFSNTLKKINIFFTNIPALRTFLTKNVNIDN